VNLDRQDFSIGPSVLTGREEGRDRHAAAAESRAADVRERLALAMEYRATGRGPQAELLCREVLRQAPEDVGALGLMAALAHEAGREVEALECIDRAIAREPGLAASHEERGVILRALGRPDEALGAFREAISLDRESATAWHGTGCALQDLTRLPEALRAYEEAVRIRPGYADALLNMGTVLTELGRPAEGLVALGAAASSRPDLPAVQDRLGTALGAAGRWEEAAEAHRRAIALHPGAGAAFCNLATALSALGRHREAADALQAALALEPNSPDAHNRMGMVLRSLGYLDQSLSAYRQALAGRPDFAEAHCNLGELLAELGRPVEALSSFRSALAFRPEFADAHARMGAVLMRLGRPAEAITSYRLALTLRPAHADLWYELGNAMREERRVPEAVAAYSHAIELQADHAAARYARGLVQLSAGDFAPGWDGYEWRWKVPELRLTQPALDAPRWKDEPLEGRTILVTAANMAADEIFRFVRYLPLLAAQGARVIFECPASLRRLLEALPAVSQAVTGGEPIPATDFHVALGSLPLRFARQIAGPPLETPYLPTRTWSTRVPLLPQGDGLRVGIAWNSREGRNARATLALAALSPLLRLPGISWYSLETSTDAEPLADSPLAADIRDLAPLVRDVADQAALMGQLDLVLTVDAAVADLAGGLGIPVWVLLSTVPGWQWGVEGNESRWYPTARLFRQSHAGGWPAVVDLVAEALSRGMAQ
jgi:tetratricopeptide (TPR) repeat protein